MKQEYEALGTIGGIQARPGMYIGDVETPRHLITEVIDNVLDEVANGYASECHIYFQNNSWWITDNGRGIAVYDMDLPDGRVKDSVHALCTEPHSGSKFDNENYKTLIGMHGVGLVVVNALSEWLTIRTRDRQQKNKIHEYYFQNSELVSKRILDNNETWSTQVGLKPKAKFFRSTDFDITPMAEQLILSQSKFPNSVFTFNGKPISKMDFATFVRKYLKLNEQDLLFNLAYTYTGPDVYDEIVHIDHNTGQEIKTRELTKRISGAKINTFITYTTDPSIVTVGDVNLRLCDGTYLTNFQTLLKNSIINKLDRKFKDVSPNLLTLGLKLYVSLTVPEPQFSSQEKVRMTLPVKDELILPIEPQVDAFLDKPGIMNIIQHNIETRMNANMVKFKGGKTKRISNENKIRDCRKIPGDVLYILEGESALGTLKQIRDPNTEAIFPLRGKVLNVESSSIQKIENNKEIKYLNESLGPRSSRRYKRIKIIADADADGHHIVVLSILILEKFADDYIRDGRVSVILPPLYGASKGKQYFPLYNHDQAEQYRQNGFDITRFKGLGEMDPDKLNISIRNGIEYVIQWPDSDQLLKSLKTIITNGDVKRSIMNDKRCTFDRVFQEVVQTKL